MGALQLLPWTSQRDGSPQLRHSEAADLCSDGRVRGSPNNILTREDRSRSELGLSLYLAARHRPVYRHAFPDRYSGEAKAYFKFVLGSCATKGEQLPGMFPIRKDTSLSEQTLDHLSGYRESLPVRTGNRAAGQIQLDNYGYVLQSLFFWRHTGGRIDRQTRSLMQRLSCYLVRHWQQPDNGIWELPEARQHTFGKVMAWLGLQRARDLGALDRREAEAVSAEIEKVLLARATRTKGGGTYFAEAYDNDEVDAAALLGFTTGFLPHDLARSTRREIERRLAADELVHRHEPGKRAGEGSFLLCSFWLIDHLIREGELEAAEVLLDKLLARASPLGLFSEEIDPASGEFLGNFPQAFSHLAVIGTIVNLHEAKRSRRWAALPEHEKFQHSVGRTVGARAVVAGFFRVPKTSRLLFSRESKWRES